MVMVMVVAVVVVIIVVVAVVVAVVSGARRVSPRLRVERRVDFFNVPAQSLDHFGDDMIGADADAPAKQLHRQVAVSQMPGDSHKFAAVMRVNFQQRLRPGPDPHHPSAIQRQPVSIPQPRRLGKIDQNLRPCLRCKNDSAAVAPVEIDENLIHMTGPGARGQNR